MKIISLDHNSHQAGRRRPRELTVTGSKMTKRWNYIYINLKRHFRTNSSNVLVFQGSTPQRSSQILTQPSMIAFIISKWDILPYIPYLCKAKAALHKITYLEFNFVVSKEKKKLRNKSGDESLRYDNPHDTEYLDIKI